jgi:hypothetical protein
MNLPALGRRNGYAVPRVVNRVSDVLFCPETEDAIMNNLRRARNSSSFSPPPEAFDYDSDVTEEAVRSIQERADKRRGDEKLEVIEGYVGQRRK